SQMTNDATKTLSIRMQNYSTQINVYWNQIMAASLVVSVPVVVAFLLLQKYLVAGLTSGTRPEVGAEPAERRAAMADLGEVAVHLGCFPLYFTEPEVRPATRYFCSNRNATTTGTLTTREAAMIWFQYTLIWVEKFCSPME